MLRRMWALLGGVLLAGTLALSSFARMDDKPGDKPGDKPSDKQAEKAPAGTWKLSLPLQTAEPWWLVRFESKENAWSGKVVASGEEMPRSQLTNVQLKDGVLQFAIKAGDARLDFNIRVPSPDAAKLMGSVGIRSNIQAVELERTTLESIDKTELNKEIVANSKDNIAVMKAAGGLIGRAGFLKAKP